MLTAGEHAFANTMKSQNDLERLEGRVKALETALQAVLQDEWRDISTAPKDGTWILLRGRNAIGRPMVPVVVAWRTGEGLETGLAWRDSASLHDMGHLVADAPPGTAADWAPLLRCRSTRPSRPARGSDKGA